MMLSPDEVRSLPNRNLNLRYKNVQVPPALNFIPPCGLEEKGESLNRGA
jgi:hypothetical protein